MKTVRGRMPSGPLVRPHSISALVSYWILAFSVFSFLCVFGRQVLAAPIRAYFPAIWYVPDAFMVAAFLMIPVFALLTGRFIILQVYLLLIAWMLYSMLLLEPLSVFYGARFVINFVIAIFVGLYCRAFRGMIERCMMLLSIIGVVGVFIDAFMGTPWADLTFESAMGTVAISKQWWLQDETRRVAGFGIASTDTALALATSLLLISNASGPWMRRVGIVLIPAGMYAIFLTQQRATIAWFVILWALSFMTAFIAGGRRKMLAFRLLKAIVVFGIIATLSAPLLLFKVDIGGLFGIDAPSLYDRTFNVWPAAVGQLLDFRTFILGGGMGIIGDPGLFTNDTVYLSDNIFLNFALSLGFIGAIIFWASLFHYTYYYNNNERFAASTLAVFSLLLLNGITAGIIVGATGLCMFGYCVGLLSSRGNASRKSQRLY